MEPETRGPELIQDRPRRANVTTFFRHYGHPRAADHAKTKAAGEQATSTVVQEYERIEPPSQRNRFHFSGSKCRVVSSREFKVAGRFPNDPFGRGNIVCAGPARAILDNFTEDCLRHVQLTEQCTQQIESPDPRIQDQRTRVRDDRHRRGSTVERSGAKLDG